FHSFVGHSPVGWTLSRVGCRLPGIGWTLSELGWTLP
ncbi:alpha/beta hydrolase, partial [Sporosarcina sp. E16_8]|nr:alpha/beta hydrolase [Sporosarcina sp. E16_8]